jgi:hypothetical protein
LIDGLKNTTVVTSDAARRDFAVVPRSLADCGTSLPEQEATKPTVETLGVYTGRQRGKRSWMTFSTDS